MATYTNPGDAEKLSTHIGERLPPDVEPLDESVDPDALDELFSSRAGVEGTVQFNHAGYRIVVRVAEGSSIVVVERI